LLAARQSINEFELRQKVFMASVLPNDQPTLPCLLQASIHADVERLFPHFDREAAEAWVRHVGESGDEAVN
jgi:hypothetical protein